MRRDVTASRAADEPRSSGTWRLAIVLLLISAVIAWIAWFAPWNRQSVAVTVRIDGPIRPAAPPAAPASAPAGSASPSLSSTPPGRARTRR